MSAEEEARGADERVVLLQLKPRRLAELAGAQPPDSKEQP
jgi:hypothetical protein